MTTTQCNTCLTAIFQCWVTNDGDVTGTLRRLYHLLLRQTPGWFNILVLRLSRKMAVKQVLSLCYCEATIPQETENTESKPGHRWIPHSLSCEST